ncbi:MAG: FGGY-family carbohydrate kinase [Clostridia bacterium]|nr:FGGY-family carbohydrate kinase [Clostridia bacterium]
MSILGIDIGTSGCKCTVFNEDGRISSYEHETYNVIYGKDGIIELDPSVVWESVLSTIKAVVKKHNGNRIAGICISSFGEAGVLIDKKGKILHNAILYSDPRGEEQCNRFIEKLSAWEITRRSGHNPAPMYSVAKLMWLMDNKPEVISSAFKFLQFSGFAAYKLCGATVEDYSLASRTMAFNILEKKWDDVLLQATDIPPALFPTVIRTGEIAGILTSEMSLETGLPKNTPVVLGGHDQITAAVGAGTIKRGMAVNGIGSVDCITPVFEKLIVNRKMQEYGYACVPFVFDGHYVTYAFNYAGGALVGWYKDTFNVKTTDDEISALSSDPTGILVLPHIMGAATPYMDTHAKGAILGLSTDTDELTLFRAMLEGAAYEAKVNIDCLSESGININRLTACGGGSRSRPWLQLRADLFNLPIDVLEFEEAGTIGAGIIGGTACGMYESIEDGVSQLVKISGTIYPDKANHERYMHFYGKYKKLYEGVKSVMGH